MATGKLNAAKVKGKLAPGMYGDGGGLWLAVGRIGPNGMPRSKSWLYRFMLDGRAREMGLGSFDDISLAEAREKAREYRRMVRIDRRDPIEERRAQDAARRIAVATTMTFQQCAETYIKTHTAAWKNGTHAAQWSNSLQRYVYPVFGSLPVQTIDTDLIVKALAPIWTEKPETASRVRGRIEAVLGWATASKFRSGDNPARWRHNLDVLLPRQVAIVKHHAAIDIDEIGAFMQELRSREGVAARALEFTILCAARTGEAIGAQWKEIDLFKRLWSLRVCGICENKK